ncbi:uncharacterized protein [Temnothorax nylanderi]|uniref:uncharacterized protein n=1 Tax=Temnothorax nylanderi TaxID=102681 RepID=UPI003A880CDF
MKVLGLWLDGNWSFGEHFTRLTPRATGSDVIRRHSLGVGSGEVTTDPGEATPDPACRGPPSVEVILHGLASGGTALAGLPPLVLAARQYAEVHRRVRALQAGGAAINLPRARVAIRLQEKMALVERWKNYLEDPTLFGRRTIDAIRPCLADWLSSRRYGLSYHSVQVLTGHGCFGGYLCRIGKEATTACHHCDGEEDTAQHTLESCPAWSVQCRVLVDAIGQDLSLPAVVAAIVGGKRNGGHSWPFVAR